jgi:regulator of protease activity HflC (stomatin/prohibitin superfamily)
MIGFVFSIIALAGLAIAGFGIFLIVQAVQRNEPARVGALLAVIGVVVAIVFFVMNAGLVEVKANEVAVVFNTLNGNLKPEPLGPGLHVIIPGVQQATLYSAAQQEYTMAGVVNEGAIRGDDAVVALTSDGQQVKIDITIIYRIDPAKANLVHVRWQGRYQDSLVRPTVRSEVRAATSQFKVEQIYGVEHQQLAQAIQDGVRGKLEAEGFQVTDVLIRNIAFSEEYVKAIDQKQVAQQQAQEAEFRVKEKEQEAAQARAVAQGEADAFRIRAEGEAEALNLINEQLAKNPLLLQWRYVEQLGPDVKLIIIPSNSPYLFDLQQLMQQTETATPAPSGQ